MLRQVFLLWIPVGLIAGGLGVFVMRARGYGLIADILLGLAGFLGAASVIVGQRWWYAHI